MDNKYYEEYMQNNAKVYSALIKKVIDGGVISDNELAFILAYRKDLKQSIAVSPVKRLLDGVKDIVNIFNTDDSNNDEEVQ